MRAVAPLLVSWSVACAEPAEVGPPLEVWVADQGAGELLVADADGVRVVADAGSVGDGFAPSAVAFDGDAVVVADFGTGTLLTLDPGGEVLGRTRPDPAQPVRIEEPCGLRVSGEHLLVLANDSRNLVELTRDGRVVRELGADRPLRSAHGFDELGDDLVIVASSPTTPDAGLLGVHDLRTGERVAELGSWPTLQEATGVAALDDGTVAVVDWFSGRVTGWDPASGAQIAVLAEGLPHPVGVTRGPDGGLFVLADDGVWRVDDGGAALLVPLSLTWPRNLAVR